MPKRIQRKRTAGWRMPEGTIYVGRPTKWGNPFTVADCQEWIGPMSEAQARQHVVTSFECWLAGSDQDWMGDRSEATRKRMLETLPLLVGHDLACWCPLDQPCHADVLLALAARKGAA